MRTRDIYLWALLCAAAWLAGILSPPFLARLDSPALVTFVRELYEPTCHQITSRTIILFGTPLAVCARCAGIYSGALAGLVALGLARKSGERETPPRWVLLAAAAPAVIDFSLGTAGLVTTSNLLRFATGAIVGIAGAFFVYPGILSLIRMLTENPLHNRFANAAGFAKTKHQEN